MIGVVHRQREIVDDEDDARALLRQGAQAADEGLLMGKIERGEHVPTLPLILKIARALKCSSAHLMTLTEAKLAESAPSAD